MICQIRPHWSCPRKIVLLLIEFIPDVTLIPVSFLGEPHGVPESVSSNYLLDLCGTVSPT